MFEIPSLNNRSISANLSSKLLELHRIRRHGPEFLIIKDARNIGATIPNSAKYAKAFAHRDRWLGIHLQHLQLQLRSMVYFPVFFGIFVQIEPFEV